MQIFKHNGPGKNSVKKVVFRLVFDVLLRSAEFQSEPQALVLESWGSIIWNDIRWQGFHFKFSQKKQYVKNNAKHWLFGWISIGTLQIESQLPTVSINYRKFGNL